MGPRAGLDALLKKKNCQPLPRLEPPIISAPNLSSWMTNFSACTDFKKNFRTYYSCLSCSLCLSNLLALIQCTKSQNSILQARDFKVPYFMHLFLFIISYFFTTVLYHWFNQHSLLISSV